MQHLTNQSIRMSLFAVLLFSILSGEAIGVPIIVGPGIVPAPFSANGGEYRIVSGTEIVSQTSQVSNGWLRGDTAANLIFGAAVEIEGGVFRGASVTTQAGITRASGGSAFSFSIGFNRGVITGGSFRGGSVHLDAATPVNSNFVGGPAVKGEGGDSNLSLKIHGGNFEGGIVSLATTPDTPISRAPAISIGNEYGGAIDVYGGTFLGGIEIASRAGNVALRVHGSEFDVQPLPSGGLFPGAAVVTVTGKYNDGSPFEHRVQLLRSAPTYVYQAGDFIAFNSINVPEPTVWAYLAVALISAVFTSRGRRTGTYSPSASARCAAHGKVVPPRSTVGAIVASVQ